MESKAIISLFIDIGLYPMDFLIDKDSEVKSDQRKLYLKNHHLKEN